MPSHPMKRKAGPYATNEINTHSRKPRCMGQRGSGSETGVKPFRTSARPSKGEDRVLNACRACHLADPAGHTATRGTRNSGAIVLLRARAGRSQPRVQRATPIRWQRRRDHASRSAHHVHPGRSGTSRAGRRTGWRPDPVAGRKPPHFAQDRREGRTGCREK